jgi:hypothetical protein
MCKRRPELGGVGIDVQRLMAKPTPNPTPDKFEQICVLIAASSVLLPLN